MLLPGHARPPSAAQPAQHPGLRRQVEPPGQLLRLFCCTVLVCSREISALTDFSGSSSESHSLPSPASPVKPGLPASLLEGLLRHNHSQQASFLSPCLCSTLVHGEGHWQTRS
ncbi:hypothetical protein FD755_022018 [Muntiacus reevesi]|uniref:Uncharacterized protein n=1 Tax=Muntiacus reevesi TaxID=9886 RepID=A0A5N3W235_MUNRE|nr:hypothetical protein FD755_022018 [Muntiacus reevesi]